MGKSYSSSPKRVLLISAIIFVVMFLVFAFARGKFELYGLGLGAFFGALFALFPLVFGLGQKVELSDKEINYSSNLLALFISKFKKRLLLSGVDEVRLGIPKFNRNQATFAAINISTTNDEITFNPDMFDNTTLHNLFQELKTRNPNIKFDNYALNLIEQGKDGAVFRKTVLGNFIWTALLIILIGLISLILFKLGVVS
ncbi:MAG: hypothetical protein US60_C0054G0012, partial [Microgenomates group bacterium GW2011_GWC1_37_8]